MQKKIKRVLTYVLALAMAVTSINAYGVPSKAETASLDLTGVVAEVDIVNGGDAGLVRALAANSYVIDGTTYTNYTSYEGVTANASSEKDKNYALNVIDRKTGTRWESEQGADPQYVQIDLGNVYSIKAIGIYWETASAANYKVEVSADGNTFEEVTVVKSNHGKRTDEIKFSKEIGVRTIRIYCTSRTTQYGNSIYELGIYGTEAQKDVVAVLSNLTIKDYYKYTGKYMLYFTEADDVAGYNVYLDDSQIPIKTIDSAGSFLDSADLAGVNVGKHTVYIAAFDDTGNESAKVSKNITIGSTVGNYNDIAQMYIYTPVSITTKYHDNRDVTVTIIDESGKIDTVDTSSNIKIRGNTTSQAPKKPWNIKLKKKKSVLGMPKGKKWCILANSFDKSLIRNRLSYQMGLENGLGYNCESRFIEVYVNGVYNGNYLITEPVETGDGRVEIDPYDADNMDVLLELGTRNEDGVDHFYTTTETFDVNEPEKGDDLTDAEVDAKIARIEAYLENFEGTLKNGTYDEILDYINEDSFVDFYIINELFKNVDFDFSSTRFYIKGDTIYAGPMWDLDLSSGNCKSSYYTSYYVDGVSWKGYYCQGMGWYKQLFKRDNFYSKVKERYAKLQYVIQNIYKEGSTQSNSIDSLVNTYGTSFGRNYLLKDLLGAGWELTNDDGYSFAAESGWKTWEEPIEFLRDWLEHRNEWLCSEWGIDISSAYEASKPSSEPATQEPTTDEITTAEPTTTSVETTTPVEITADELAETTTEVPVETTTAALTISKQDTTTVAQTEDATTKVKSPAKAKIKKVKAKKKSAKKVKISLKKIKDAAGYQVAIYKTKKKAKKNKKPLVKKIVKKRKFTIKSKKLKQKSKLFIRVRAFILDGNGNKVYGKWSKIRKVKIKK